MALQAPRLGQDLVDVARFRRALEGKQERWRRRIFTAAEWTACEQEADPAAALALRFAAKEAAFKALGTGWGRGVAWRDVEVPGDGRATVDLVLHGRAGDLARQEGLVLAVSLASSGLLAVALVVARPTGAAP